MCNDAPHAVKVLARAPRWTYDAGMMKALSNRLGLWIAGLGFTFSGHFAHAIDVGPFSVVGFAKAELSSASNQCPGCQRFPDENKQRLWADELVPGAGYGTRGTSLTLFQPWLRAGFDLGKGWRTEGLLSQRLRDGKVDIPGSLYEANLAIAHEDFGRLAIGAMPTRAWSLADYPFGSHIGLADFWASSGAGYGLHTQAVRYTSRLFDVADGDLALELSWDRGDTRFKIHKPWLAELYVQYRRGDLLLDGVYQDSRNGNPQAWGHGPFKGLTGNPADDARIGGAGQSIAMVMATYSVTTQWTVHAGLRKNRWSGAHAVITGKDPATGADLWNNMFNVDWNGNLGGITNPGYAATSVDAVVGARWRRGQWSASVGLGHLGRAKTANPSERGQRNTNTIVALGLNHDFLNGFQAYVMGGAVRYGRLGLSPMSQPSNAAFTGVDSRVARSGNWVGAGVVYTF